MSAFVQRNLCLIAATALAFATASTAHARDAAENGPGAARGAGTSILIRDARVHTVSAHGSLDAADVLVRGGRIAAVSAHAGERLSVPPGATVVEAHGRPLTPGLFAGLSHIGIEEISAESSTVDARLDLKAPSWNQKWRPEFDVVLAYNPRSTLVPVARIEGLTWTVLAPAAGDSIIAGQGAAVVLDGRLGTGSQAMIEGSRSLFVQLGSAAEKVSGGTRAAAYMLLDQAIAEARAQGPMTEDALLHPAGRGVLAHYLAGGRVVFDVERAADILEVIAFAERNHLKPVIHGGSEAWLVAKALAHAHVPVVLNTLQDLPSDLDRLSARLDNAARLQRAGVLIAFSSGDSHNARTIRQLAGNAVAHGLPWDAALAAITANPAEIFGVGGTRGHVEAGQAADLVLWDGDPLEVTSAADQVWIGGMPVQMRSRQTELRDRYLGSRGRH